VSAQPERYVPAARWHALTRLYDPIVAATMRERRFRGELADLAAAALPEGGSLVDVGCGTGTFAIAFAARRPDARVAGVDGDPAILALAGRKPGAEAVDWVEGLAGALPLPEASVDAVTMSLLLHHLLPADKHAALTDARRVLRPGGHLHIADWGRPHDPAMRATFTLLQAIDGFANTRDHSAGRLPAIVAAAGFGPVATHARLRTAFGSLEILSAARS
jgi:ubiquinone/menaquinone biosynthesis C-methylase UbiE